MKHLGRILSLVLSVMLLLAAVPSALGGSETKTVKKISIETKPDKTVYMLGEEFDPAGGVLSVTYKDKTTELVPMTDERVTFSGTNFSSEGKKSVTVEFGGKSVRLSVSVSGKGFEVTFDENREGGAVSTVSVASGAAVAPPGTAWEGHDMLGWYTDPDFRALYDFSLPVRGDLTLYACWILQGAERVNVTFDYGYYGDALTAYTRTLAAGETVARPADPVRAGYGFEAWIPEDGETAYAFDTPVTADITLNARWRKLSDGAQAYVFEAEDTDLTGKEGVTSSGATAETAMILFDTAGTMKASGSRYVAYLYKPNLSVDFLFACGEDISDAVISLRVASELPGEYTFSPDTYTVLLNGVPLAFEPFTLKVTEEQVRGRSMEFVTVKLAENAALREGENVLQVYPSNSIAIPGTTYRAVAPMVDCLEIVTSAVLIWDAVKGLPAANY